MPCGLMFHLRNGLCAAKITLANLRPAPSVFSQFQSCLPAPLVPPCPRSFQITPVFFSLQHPFLSFLQRLEKLSASLNPKGVYPTHNCSEDFVLQDKPPLSLTVHPGLPKDVIHLCSTLVPTAVSSIGSHVIGTQSYFHLLPCWISPGSSFSVRTEVSHRPVAGHKSHLRPRFQGTTHLLMEQGLNKKIQSTLGRFPHCRDHMWGGF